MCMVCVYTLVCIMMYYHCVGSVHNLTHLFLCNPSVDIFCLTQLHITMCVEEPGDTALCKPPLVFLLLYLHYHCGILEFIFHISPCVCHGYSW